MGFDAEDKEIVRLLTKLKEADGKYPPDLLSARRQDYLKQMGEIGMGIGAGIKIKNAINSAKTPTLSSATSTVLESALVVAIVAETGTVAYFYRDKLADIIHTITKKVGVQEVTPSPVHTELEIQGITLSPAVTSMLPSVTLSTSVSPTEPELTSTPIPGLVEDTSVNNTISANSTSTPKGNNGNHYGQTPKPQRTKEPKHNNNDKPPKDNSNLPKDNSKPTKTK